VVAETYSLGKPGHVTIATTGATLSQTINFTSAAKVVDTLSANSLTVNVHGLYSDHVSMSNSATVDGFATNRIDSATGGPPRSGMPSFLLPSIVFANKTNLRLNTLDSNDTFVLNVTQSATGMKSLTLVGGGGTNTAYVYHLPPHVQVHFVRIQHIVYETPNHSPVVPPPSGVPIDRVPPAVTPV
jgi:hypothetical protein